MKRNDLMMKISLFVLVMVVLWRCIGAPVSSEDFLNLKTEFWQSRMLLPSRLAKMLSLWVYSGEGSKTDNADGNEIVRVFSSSENRVVELPIEEYVRGVTAAEMPAQYHLEALKAQMVAARTRVLWQMEQGGCGSDPEADVCTDAAHCQGYASENECKEKWGENYAVCHQRLLDAQRATEGEWIAYEGKPIAVMYHAVSGGKTENAESVFSQYLPYLVSVESQGEERAGNFQHESFFSYEELAEKVSKEICNKDLTADEIRRSFSILEYTESGRVKSVQFGQEQMDAVVLRSLLGLRSTFFTTALNEAGITFYQKGYGHGVGMSQAGANAMAAAGADYRQILEHYYTGVKICK